MKYAKLLLCSILSSVWIQCVTSQGLPHLQKQGPATQLIVDNKPFLMLGGELGNSSAADFEKIKVVFPQLKAMNLNTVLTPVYWELIEPEEDTFNFQSVDILVNEARKSNLKLVLLWFGSWKNSMSCYAPAWVKTNRKRFPYSQTSDRKNIEILTPFSEENLKADKKAFITLMEHLKKTDGNQHTVIMIQVENEIGMIPEARDRIDSANRLYQSEIPPELKNYLTAHKNTLHPSLSSQWANSGYAAQGNWETIFGKNIYTEEIFQAWYFGLYVEEIIKAGKAVYNLPMYVNAALNSRDRKPGEYPSAGPLAHLIDIWRAAAPSIDFLAPDIYDQPFDYWCKQYDMPGNPLFIPETLRGNHTAARVFYAFGAHNAMGFCPFSIESTENPTEDPLVKSYDLLNQLSPLMASVQGKDQTRGFWFHSQQLHDTVIMGDFIFRVSHDYTLGWSLQAKQEQKYWPETGGLIIQLSENEFIAAGTGIVITCAVKHSSDKTSVGILACDRGIFDHGKWIPVQRLNGDETHQGRHVRIPAGECSIQKFQLYIY